MTYSPKLRTALLRSVLEQIAIEEGADYELEWSFHKARKWRFDAALWTPSGRWALEVDGGGWTNGRHNRESGRVKEREKYNEAALLGWRILAVTWKQVENGECLDLLMRACEEGR